MATITRAFGPKSKYDQTIPYTYEAVLNVLEDEETITVSYLGDTICGLTNFLKKRRVSPEQVKMYEIFRGKKTPVPKEAYTTSEGRWMPKHKLCAAMTERYGEEKDSTNCQFRDRAHFVSDPC